MTLRKTFLALALGATLLSGAVPLAVDARGGAEVTLNLKDAELGTLIQTVSEVTGKNFIVDPRVRGKVTVISSSPMDADGVYATFLSVLQVQGFAAIPSGSTIKIVPETNARADGGGLISGGGGLAGDEVVTHVYSVQNVSAAQLVAILRPLISQSGHFAAYAGNNSLIISDRASNVVRIERLIAQIDLAGDRDVDVIKLENASAADVVRVITGLNQSNKQADPTAQQSVVIADERSNSVLIGGEKGERSRLADIVRRLDAPSANGGDTQVIYLRYASAENLAPILEGYAQQQAKGAASRTAGAAAGNAAPAASGGGSGDTRVIADKDTNALVITAAPKTMQALRGVIAQLDIRRKQILVDAIIAEVSATKASELGLDYAYYNPSTGAASGILNQSTVTALSNIGTAAAGLTTSSTSTTTSTSSSSTLIGAAASLIGQGATAAVGGFGSSGSFFALLLKALATDADTNILSTPQLTTSDNQEAKFSVGQEVPFLTGSFSSTGTSSTSGTVNPFQTIERKEVGLKLGITPTVNEGNHIKLKIDLESSSLTSTASTTLTQTTNKRTLTNTVTMESDQILFIGGLIDDQLDDSQTRIPLLSSIPLIGSLFKSRSVQKTKRNLMIFMHPVILAQRDDADYYTRMRYDAVRDSEVRAATGAVPLIGGSRPTLLPYDDYQRQSRLPPAPPLAVPSAPAPAAPAAAPVAPAASAAPETQAPVVAPAPADAAPAPTPAPAPAPAP